MADEPQIQQSGVSSPRDGDAPKLKIWKTIRTGIYSSAYEGLSCFSQDGGNFIFQLAGNYFKIGGYAHDEIMNLHFGTTEKVFLAIVSMRQLGFKYRPRYKDVCVAITQSKEIEFCTGEDLFLARLHYSDQTPDSKIFVPIGSGEDKEDKRLLFRFEHYRNANVGRDEYWILVSDASFDRVCESDELMLVRLVGQLDNPNAKVLLNLLNSVKQARMKKEARLLDL